MFAVHVSTFPIGRFLSNLSIESTESQRPLFFCTGPRQTSPQRQVVEFSIAAQKVIDSRPAFSDVCLYLKLGFQHFGYHSEMRPIRKEHSVAEHYAKTSQENSVSEHYYVRSDLEIRVSDFLLR